MRSNSRPPADNQHLAVGDRPSREALAVLENVIHIAVGDYQAAIADALGELDGLPITTMQGKKGEVFKYVDAVELAGAQAEIDDAPLAAKHALAWSIDKAIREVRKARIT